MGEDEENQYWLMAVVGGVVGVSEEERNEGRYDMKWESQRIYHTNLYRSS